MPTKLRARLSTLALVPILAAHAVAVRPLPIGDDFTLDEQTDGTQNSVVAAHESDGGAFDLLPRPVFIAGFESGSFADWDAVVDPGKDRAEFLAQACD